MAPSGRPNYALRRALTLGVLVVVVLGVGRIVAAVVADGGDGDEAAAPTVAGARTASSSSSTSTTAVPLVDPPACSIGDTESELVLESDWQRTIIDTEFRLPEGYEPPDLVPASAAGFDERFSVRELLIEDLAALREAAEANGTPIELLAAYRSIADQRALFARREVELGPDEALARTARAGHSEHHLGTTVDFKTAGAEDVFASWAGEPAGRWVLANAHRFGFVLSYPEGEWGVSCYEFEPWHYRYFGRDLAARIRESGLTPREYLWHWQETGSEPTSASD